MYSCSVLRVNMDTNLSNCFKFEIGVKQLDNLSPTLFSIFINDSVNIFDESCHPVYLGSESINCILYADDLVLMSTKADGLQNFLISLPTTVQNGAYQ